MLSKLPISQLKRNGYDAICKLTFYLLVALLIYSLACPEVLQKGRLTRQFFLAERAYLYMSKNLVFAKRVPHKKIKY